MAADQALEALDRIEQMERQEQQSSPSADVQHGEPEAGEDADDA
jgi:hypothetical protein